MADVILNMAYVALLAAAFTTTLGRLRVLLIVGACCFLIFGLATEIWSMVAWNVAIGGLHAFRMARDFRVQRSVDLTAEESVMRDRLSPAVSDFDFHMFWAMGTEVLYNNRRVIARGSCPPIVSLICNGEVEVRDESGSTIATLGPGSLIGEMSFVSAQPSTADVFALGVVAAREWDQRKLRSLEQTHSPSARAFQRLISRDLIAKTNPGAELG